MRISPHFQSLELSILQNVLTFILTLILLRAYRTSKNHTALTIAFAGWAMILGYLSALFGYHFYPDDIVIQTWFSNIISEMFFFVGWTYFAIAGIYLRFKKLSLTYSLLILLFGFIAVLGATRFFEPMELLANGTVDFHRNFLIDFTQYLMAVYLVMLYGNAFLSGMKNIKSKIGVWLIIVGFAFGVGGTNIIPESNSAELVVTVQYIVNIGQIMIIAGMLWVGTTQEHIKKSERTEISS